MGFLEKIFNKKKNTDKSKDNLQIKNTDSLGDIAIKLAKSGIISVPKDDNHNTFGEKLDELVDGDLPWGWENAKQEFIKPRDNKLYDLSIRASKTENIDEEIKLLKEFITFFKEYENECLEKGECYQKYFLDMHIKQPNKTKYSWLNDKKDRLKYLEENYQKIKKEIEIKERESKDLSKKLIEMISKNPGILQSDIYKQFHEVMKDEISSKLYFWNKNGKIRREKSGRTYKIYYNN